MAKKKSKEAGTSAPTDHLQHVPALVQTAHPLKRLPAVFFRTEAGNEPVREWLKDDNLSREDRVKIGSDIRAVEIGWPLGMPLCRALGKGLWEVRTSLQERIARVIFFIHDGEMILLHGFIKKDRHTPQPDLDVAMGRKRQMENDK